MDNARELCTTDSLGDIIAWKILFVWQIWIWDVWSYEIVVRLLKQDLRIVENIVMSPSIPDLHNVVSITTSSARPVYIGAMCLLLRVASMAACAVLWRSTHCRVTDSRCWHVSITWVTASWGEDGRFFTWNVWGHVEWADTGDTRPAGHHLLELGG